MLPLWIEQILAWQEIDTTLWHTYVLFQQQHLDVWLDSISPFACGYTMGSGDVSQLVSCKVLLAALLPRQPLSLTFLLFLSSLFYS